MNWIRVVVGMKNDASVCLMAEACRVRVSEMVGCVVNVLCELPTQARDGDIAGTPDRLIEQWAVWEGRRGVFAGAFRKYLVTDSGVVRSWHKHNGAAIREADTKRSDARKWRERKALERSGQTDRADAVGPAVGPTKPTPNALRGAVTGRDGTGRTINYNNLPTPDGVRSEKAAKADAKFPHFAKPTCDAAYDIWLSEMGAANYGQFRTAFGPLFSRPESERPTTLPRDAELVPAIKLYVAAVIGTPEARFATPKKCAESLTRIVDALREGGDSEGRLNLAQFALGTTPRATFRHGNAA